MRSKAVLLSLIVISGLWFNWSLFASLLDQQPQSEVPHGPPPLEVHSFWSGHVDESLVGCWYVNHLNPDIHQIFHLEDTEGWTEALEVYPFLRDVDARPFEWKEVLPKMGIPMSEQLVQRVPKFTSNNRSNILRYALMFILDSVFYIDSDVCVFNIELPDFDLREHQVLVREPQAGSFVTSTALFRLDSLLPQARRLMAPLYLEKAPIGSLLPGHDYWGVIGVKLFHDTLKPLPKRTYPEVPPTTDTITYFTTKLAFGWEWNQHSSQLCDIWNAQVAGGFSIHLWRDLRKKHRTELLELTQLAKEGKSWHTFCATKSE